MTLEQINDAFLRDRETPLHEVVGMHQELKPKNIKKMKVKEIEQLVAQLDAPRLIEVRMHHSDVTMAFGRDGDWCIMWNADGKAQKRAILPGTDDEECQKSEYQWGNWLESPEYDLL